MSNGKYRKQSYLIDYKYTSKHWGKWAVIVMDKEDVRVVNWFDSLKKAVAIGAQIKDSAYFLSIPAASGFFVPVAIGYKNKEIKILCSVDTGSYYSVFSREVADVLGINLKKRKKEISYGVNGASSLFRIRNIKIQLSKEKRVINLVADFSDKNNTPSLLGCFGFLDFYEVCFSPDYGMKFRFAGKNKTR